jgi:hypothetical protein
MVDGIFLIIKNELHVSIAKLFQQLPVKKRAMKATSLCIA